MEGCKPGDVVICDSGAFGDKFRGEEAVVVGRAANIRLAVDVAFVSPGAVQLARIYFHHTAPYTCYEQFLTLKGGVASV